MGCKTNRLPVNLAYKNFCRTIIKSFNEDALNNHWTQEELKARLKQFRENWWGDIVFTLAEMDL